MCLTVMPWQSSDTMPSLCSCTMPCIMPCIMPWTVCCVYLSIGPISHGRMSNTYGTGCFIDSITCLRKKSDLFARVKLFKHQKQRFGLYQSIVMNWRNESWIAVSFKVANGSMVCRVVSQANISPSITTKELLFANAERIYGARWPVLTVSS